MNLLNLEHVCKKFVNIKALDHLSLKFRGGVLGFIGPNGAGKTTTINILGGFIKADSGEVEVLGLDPWNDRIELYKRMGLMPDEVSLPSGLTGYRVLKHEAKIHGIKDCDKRILEVSSLLGIKDFLDRRVGTYSSGMYKRLLIARTLLNPELELVVLDEPFSNIDVESIITITKLIVDMKREGRNFLIASHILPHLLPVCSDFAFIFRGRVVAKGSFSELLGRIDRFHYLIRFEGNWRSIIQELTTYEEVSEYRLDELGLHLVTRKPWETLSKIYGYCVKHDLKILEVSLYPDPLTQVFFKLGGSDEN